MKVLFLERSLGRGGAQRQLVTLACGLARRGDDVVVVLFYDEGPLIDDLHRAEIRVRVLHKTGRWDTLGFLLRLRRVLKDERPDVLCTFLTVPNLVSVFCRLLQPRLRLVWGIRASNMDLSRYDWLARLTYGVEPWLARFADSIVANSNQGRAEALAKGFPPGRIRVIWNGIDTDRFRPDPAGRDRVRKEWGLNDDAVVVGLIARLDPMKDHETFLRAAAIAARRRPDIHFVCVGDDGVVPRSDLEAHANTLGLTGRIIWSHGRDDMPAVYSACDLTCLTSVGEGFPNMVAEAMACARMCVVTRVGDAEQIVGPTGRMVAAGDSEHLARSIVELCDEISFSQAQCDDCRRRIVDLFSVETMVSAFEGVFAAALRT